MYSLEHKTVLFSTVQFFSSNSYWRFSFVVTTWVEEKSKVDPWQVSEIFLISLGLQEVSRKTLKSNSFFMRTPISVNQFPYWLWFLQDYLRWNRYQKSSIGTSILQIEKGYFRIPLFYMTYLVAGAGFEPTTFGLWARRAARLLHPASEAEILPFFGGLCRDFLQLVHKKRDFDLCIDILLNGHKE